MTNNKDVLKDMDSIGKSITKEIDESIDISKDVSVLIVGFIENENPIEIPTKVKLPEGLTSMVVNYSKTYGTVNLVLRDFCVGIVPSALFEAVDMIKETMAEETMSGVN